MSSRTSSERAEPARCTWFTATISRLVLKILKEEHRRNAVQQARLVNEAEALRVLGIPGVVQVFGDGDFEGRPYYVMEYLPTTLAERLGKPLLPSQIVPVIESWLASLRSCMRAAMSTGI